MKKCALFLLLLTAAALAAAAKPRLELNLTAPIAGNTYNGTDDSRSWSVMPVFPAFLPTLQLTFALPSSDPWRVYVGGRVFAIVIANSLEGVVQVGYQFPAFSRWNTHYLELLGTFSAGAYIAVLDGIGVFPLAECEVQLYLLPEHSGFMASLGPVASFLCTERDAFPRSTDVSISARLSLGWKF